MDSLLNEIYPPGRPRRFHLRVADEIKRISRIPWLHAGFTFYLVPKATPRPRQTTLKNGRMIFYVKGANDHKQFLKEYLQNEDISLIETPIKFDCKTYLPIPKSMPPSLRSVQNLDWCARLINQIGITSQKRIAI